MLWASKFYHGSITHFFESKLGYFLGGTWAFAKKNSCQPKEDLTHSMATTMGRRPTTHMRPKSTEIATSMTSLTMKRWTIPPMELTQQYACEVCITGVVFFKENLSSAFSCCSQKGHKRSSGDTSQTILSFSTWPTKTFTCHWKSLQRIMIHILT